MREPATLSRRAAAALPLAALLRPAAAALSTTAVSAALTDPVLEQIEHHRALRTALGAMAGLDDDPAYMTACDVEEAALQGSAMSRTAIGGAAAMLAYMDEVEGDFADHGSPCREP